MRSGLIALALVLAAVAAPAASDKKAPVEKKVVDAGSFGIFVGGRRIATEKFEIEQVTDGNITRSELKVDNGEIKAMQKSELQMDAAGRLRRYSWNELSPGKAEATVVPQDQFLMERMLPSPAEKALEQPFILPTSTVILDDYFFAQRQVLAWRYLASGCQPGAGGQTECKLAPVRYGALIPRQRTSVLVNVEYVGKEKVRIRGEERELIRFNLTGEGMDWALWMDGSYKLIRIVIAADNTEVVRD
jgi:hypothetical protein